MNDPELDLLLAEATPSVVHDADCERCRSALARRPARRWRRRVAALGVAGVGLVAVGAGAAATVGLPFVGLHGSVEHTQTTSTGGRCTSTYLVHPAGSDSPRVVEARAYLATLDIDSLDISDELADMEEENADPNQTQDDREEQALFQAVADAVFDHLRETGLGVGEVYLGAESMCDVHGRVRP